MFHVKHKGDNMTISQAAKSIAKIYKLSTLMWQEVNNEPTPLYYTYTDLIQLTPLYHVLNIDVVIDGYGSIFESNTNKCLFKLVGELK